MFGWYYVYWGKKLMIVLSKVAKRPEWNGIWIATEIAYHESLLRELPELQPFLLEGADKLSNWLLLPDGADDFETSAVKICELISHCDARIGRITKKSPAKV
ncbi:hypothetical protein [Mucilaginibacter sp. L3T2-6]|uniref:hypothetical protein n=1 Tax=Mucilaginibacter sp. L3T2-6 TaxID=3062491 RepID=UPI0026765C3C|nr:hypothetical protein [Mucilaginibacter sp. L3T2-6]MDO3642911.1 hypothetical protein [Mucilaginibacter sp. L3T2-6]MDV6215236.1 hypothetical protein [Mucilaginibacter sp. L3T2-6]